MATKAIETNGMTDTIAGVVIPDTRLVREVTDFIRDAEDDLLFDHSRRVFLFGALQGHCRGLQPDLELLYAGAMFHDLGVAVVEFSHGGTTHSVAAACEVVVSLGAVNTPKILMQSGIGDVEELQRFGIPIVSHLLGVGQNYQNHPRIACVWQCREPLVPRNNAGEAMVLWKSDPLLEAPDLQICIAELPLSSPENAAVYHVPEHGWTACAGVLRPKSRGRVRLTALIRPTR